MATRKLDVHPAVLFARSRGWDYAKTAAFLRCPHGVFRQIVRGFCGVSIRRADQWERLSKGEIRAIDLLRWHERNRRTAEAA